MSWRPVVLVVAIAAAISGAIVAVRIRSAKPVPATSAAAVSASSTVSPSSAPIVDGAAPPYPLGSDNPSITLRTKWRVGQLAAAAPDDYARASAERGHQLFTRVFTAAEGLGPYFNAESCSACHSMPVLLGHGPIERSARVYGTGRVVKDHEMTTKLLPYERVAGTPPFELPPGYKLIGKRTPPSLRGLGWVEVVEGAQILAQPHCDSPEPAPDHVCGWAAKRSIGLGTLRFGAKMNVATLEEFIAGALALEMGLLTEFPIAPTDPPVTKPELPNLAVIDLANFIAFSDPPGTALSPEHADGARIFESTGCRDCHWSSFEVGDRKAPQMYSDLLAHDMGAARAETDFDHLTPPGHYRTTPLWGLRDHPGPYLHDGAAATLDEAVSLHAGEATAAHDRYKALDDASREALLSMLGSL